MATSKPKESMLMRQARASFWNHWKDLPADERRITNSASMLKGWLANALYEEKKRNELQEKSTTREQRD